MCILYFNPKKGSICFLVLLNGYNICFGTGHIFAKVLIRPCPYSLLPKLYLILSISFKFYFCCRLCRLLQCCTTAALSDEPETIS